VARMTRQMAVVEKPQKFPRPQLGSRRNLLRRLQIRNRLVRVERRALKDSGQESGVPVVAPDLWDPARIGNGDEGGQVLIFGAQRVADPRTHAGASIENVATAHLVFGWAVRVLLSSHRMDESLGVCR